MSSKPWGGAGAWAVEAERAEAEEKERAASMAAAGGIDSFPTLGEAVSAKARRKKSQTLSISEFTVGKYVGPGGKSRSMSDVRGLTAEEMMMLPTGPRDRSGEEQQYGGIGGGFRTYGMANRGGSDRDRDRGFGEGFDREREASSYRRDREREREEPSRADGNDNWAATKKHLPSYGGGGYDEDRRGTRMSDRDLPSRADEIDNWAALKKPLPPAMSEAYDRRGSRYEDRREGFDESRFSSRADEVDNWQAEKRIVPPAADRRPVGRFDSAYRDEAIDSDRWNRREPFREEPQRRRLVLAPRTLPLTTSPPPGPRGEAETYSARPPSPSGMLDAAPPPPSKPKSNPFGSARPREEVLAEKKSDWRRTDADYALKDRDSMPSSSHSSRPVTPEVPAEATVKPRPKINPFGDAKPREVLLEEKGMDWRKIDFELEHRAVDRPETEEEKKLKEDICILTELVKQEADAVNTKLNGIVSAERDGGSNKGLSAKEQLLAKERELERLIRAFDDQVRFSQKGSDRPGSRSGRADIGRAFDAVDRPVSRSGIREGRSFDSLERPGSRSGRSEGGRSLDSFERQGSHSGWGESGRSIDSIDRPGSRSGHIECGQVHELPRERRGPDIWTGPSEDVVDRRDRYSLDDRDRQRRF